jgi:hypothetical protein
MVARQARSALKQFIDDELLRAPLVFDQVIDGCLDQTRKSLASMSPIQRSIFGDLMQAMLAQRARLADYFVRSLREQVDTELARQQPGAKPAKAMTLALVDEDEVALDVELSHLIEAIKSTAEYELRELQTYTSALVGDMDVTADHNPFRADTYARALSDAAQALPLSRGHQVAFMRYASTPLAQVLRTSYAASSSRLEAMGVEPAAYRTLILPSGSRRGPRSVDTTFSPDLIRMRETMPAELDAQQPAPASGATAAASPREHWTDIARNTPSQVDRQSIELISRLFEAMLSDDRVPPDVSLQISRLHGPAMRLALRDGGLLDHDKHPLWRFINRLVFEAQMTPDPVDPDRVLLLKVAQATIDQLAAEPEQNNGLYRWAMDRMESFLHKRLARHLSASSSQIGALQKIEDKLMAGQTALSSFHGMLDIQGLDTVPAELMEAAAPPPKPEGGSWVDTLSPGDWVRMFLQGRWVHARLLWPGERREVWLFGDGASDATWAVRRSALLTMHKERLAKTLKQRSIVGSAAARVHEAMAVVA